MYRTQELRWFLEGELPEPVGAWFGTGGAVGVEPERTDAYLAVPGCETVGIKIREGRFEVKALTRRAVEFRIGGVAGRRDGWVKWSRALPGAETLRASGDDRWILVNKRRRLRRYGLDDGGVAQLATSDPAPREGCQVELSTIRVRFDDDGPGPSAAARSRDTAPAWWSLSFEAFGDSGRLVANLERVAGRVLSRPPPVPLDLSASLAYPALLARLCERPR